MRFADAHAVRAAAGREVCVTDWLSIDQRRIDTFAEATGDLQWIHVADGGLQLIFAVTVEIEGGSKPALVAESVVRRYPKPEATR